MHRLLLVTLLLVTLLVLATLTGGAAFVARGQDCADTAAGMQVLL